MSANNLKKYNRPTAIVVFGGTGDLASTKLFPALFNLYLYNALPDTFVVVGLSRKDLTDESYQAFVRSSITATKQSYPEAVVKDFCNRFCYISGDFNQAMAYNQIKAKLAEVDGLFKQCTNKLFYLAVPPQFYGNIFTYLHESKVLALCDGVDSWARLLVEKPFGNDLTTARELEQALSRLFSDDQLYRIDHYLAKNAIENIIALRFTNSLIADSWNRDRIESISIRLLETKDVSNRGSLYDSVGTLRDVGQNHLLQILALLIMPEVAPDDSHSVRNARLVALEMVLGQPMDEIIRGQYDGFVATMGVQQNSQTETYFKIVFTPEAGAWAGVKFTLEAGKALATTINEAEITFRPLGECHCLAETKPHTHRNVLKIQFSPEEKISLSMWTRQPGFDFSLGKQELLLVNTPSTESYSPEAYERVLYDCIAGDQTRFVSGPEVEAAWQFITPMLEQFPSVPLQSYQPGSTGPH